MRKGFATIAYAIVGTLAALFRSANMLHLLDPAPADNSGANLSDTQPSGTVSAMPGDPADLQLEPAAYRLEESPVQPRERAGSVAVDFFRTIHLAANAKPSSAPAKAASAQKKKSDSQINQALDNMHLTSVQRLSVLAYIGHQHDVATNVSLNDVQDLTFRDPRTRKYKGEVILSLRPDGSVQVAKIAGAEFDHAKQVEVLILQREAEQAQQVLTAKRSKKVFEQTFAETRKPGHVPTKESTIGLKVPTVKWHPTTPYHRVSQSAAVFGRDGSGTESGWTTNLGGATGGFTHRNAPAAGGGSGGGNQTVKINYFKNYFLPPHPNKQGKFTRSVMTAKAEANVTVNNFKSNTAIAYGSATAVSDLAWNYTPQPDYPVEVDDGIGDEGIATPPTETVDDDGDGTPDEIVAPEDTFMQDMGFSDSEAEAYQQAIDDGSADALNKYLNDYAGSPYEDDVKDRLTEDTGSDATGGKDEPADENFTIY